MLVWLLIFFFWVSSAFAAAPTVTTQASTNTLSFTATGNGNVTNDGGLSVTDRGVVWNLTGTPTTADNKVSAGAGTTGAFTVPLTALTPQVRHYARAYAINSGGTSYGASVDIYPEPDRIFRCYIGNNNATILTAFPECHALIGGKTYYVTDLHFSQSAASTLVTHVFSVQSGTTNTNPCDTATATIYSSFSTALFPAGPGRFLRPLKITAGHNLCWIQSVASNKNVILLGFVGSTAQAAEIRTSSAVDFYCTMSSAATALTMITGCDALTAGKSYYITSFNWSSSIISSTANFMTLSAGTGANCVTTNTALYSGYTQANFGVGGPGSFAAPIKAPANNMLCFTHAGSGTRLLTVAGFVQ